MYITRYIRLSLLVTGLAESTPWHRLCYPDTHEVLKIVSFTEVCALNFTRHV